MLYGLIIMNGAPGSGKSTLSDALKERFGGVAVNFGELREFHLKPDWSDQSPEDVAIAFENLVSIITTYRRHGWEDIIVHDLPNGREQELHALFSLESRLITLIADPSEIERRVRERTVGFRNVDWALEWNEELLHRQPIKNELRIDTSSSDIETALGKLTSYLGL